MVVRGAGLGRAKSWPATRGDLERRRKCVTRIGLGSRRVVRMYTCAQGVHSRRVCVCAHAYPWAHAGPARMALLLVQAALAHHALLCVCKRARAAGAVAPTTLKRPDGVPCGPWRAGEKLFLTLRFAVAVTGGGSSRRAQLLCRARTPDGRSGQPDL